MSDSVESLLSNKSRWTQGHLSIDSYGSYVDPLDDNACSWCLIGACIRVYGDAGSYRALNKLCHAMDDIGIGGCGIPRLNDVLGYDKMMEVVRKAGV